MPPEEKKERVARNRQAAKERQESRKREAEAKNAEEQQKEMQDSKHAKKESQCGGTSNEHKSDSNEEDSSQKSVGVNQEEQTGSEATMESKQEWSVFLRPVAPVGNRPFWSNGALGRLPDTLNDERQTALWWRPRRAQDGRTVQSLVIKITVGSTGVTKIIAKVSKKKLDTGLEDAAKCLLNMPYHMPRGLNFRAHVKFAFEEVARMVAAGEQLRMQSGRVFSNSFAMRVQDRLMVWGPGPTRAPGVPDGPDPEEFKALEDFEDEEASQEEEQQDYATCCRREKDAPGPFTEEMGPVRVVVRGYPFTRVHGQCLMLGRKKEACAHAEVLVAEAKPGDSMDSLSVMKRAAQEQLGTDGEELEFSVVHEKDMITKQQPVAMTEYVVSVPVGHVWYPAMPDGRIKDDLHVSEEWSTRTWLTQEQVRRTHEDAWAENVRSVLPSIWRKAQTVVAPEEDEFGDVQGGDICC